MGTDKKNWYVYGLKPVGQPGPVKFGVTTNSPQRLLYCNRWSPLPLEVIFTVPGSHLLERKVQAYCAAAHSHHEWFHDSPETRAVTEAVLSGVALEDFLPDALPEHHDIDNRRRGGFKALATRRAA